jgi:hypothetical protein
MTVVPFPRRGGRPPQGPFDPQTPRIIDIALPDFHDDQVRAFWSPGRFRAVRAGRRWGKTTFALTIGADYAVKGCEVGWFAPNYKLSMEAFHDIDDILAPVIVESNKSLQLIRTRTGGRLDIWTLEDERAGRSRRYHLVILDEAAFAKENALEIWERSIRPTLVDYRGAAIVTSNTNGSDPQNFFWRLCNDKAKDGSNAHGFSEFHAPSRNNPFLPQEELDDLRHKSHPLVWLQEYEAEFVDWRGTAFFSLARLLLDGRPVEWPQIADWVFATVDTAIKSGQEHDGTAVCYWALSNIPSPHLTILDWDIVSIDGAVLIEWLPGVFAKLESFTKAFRVRFGSGSVFIEDKGSGTILIQHGEANGWPVQAIDTELTAKGKDERAIAVSGFHHEGLCKISQVAYDRTVMWHEQEMNHFLSQVTGFRIGDKEGAKRADDLVDTYMYGLSIGLGNWAGF